MKFHSFFNKKIIFATVFLFTAGFVFAQEVLQEVEPDIQQEAQVDFEETVTEDETFEGAEEIEEELESIEYTTIAWSLDSQLQAEIDKSNIIIKDAATLTEQYIIETPYENILSIQFVNPGFYTSTENYYLAFITDSNVVEMRQIGYYQDDEGNIIFYDEILFSMQGSKNQSEEVAEEEEEAEPEEGTHQYEALALIRYKNTNTVSFKLKVSYIPKPYILGISLAAGYTDYTTIQPFYFGGFLEPHIGIPQKAFPYEYELRGTSISGPLIVGGKLLAPFGICVYPFQQNIEFYVEIAPGLSLNMMWNTKFGADAVSSQVFPAFYGALRTGASFRGFSVFLEGNYDAILGFGMSFGLSYSLSVHTPTVDYAPTLE